MVEKKLNIKHKIRSSKYLGGFITYLFTECGVTQTLADRDLMRIQESGDECKECYKE